MNRTEHTETSAGLAGDSRIAGHALVEALIAQQVDTVFGVPGESFLAVLDGFHAHAERLRFVACRHEGGAAFMADAAAKLSGKPGVCIVTRGPGASNAAIGVHTAFQDSTPMVLLVGQVAADQRDREAFQELDYRQFFGPGTLGMAKWVGEIQSADRIPEYVARAFHVAQQGRPGPVVLVLPEDLLRTPTAVPVLPAVNVAHAWPAPGALRQLRGWLAEAQRPLMLVGGSGWTAASGAALQRFAENWRLPVACAFRFQDAFDNRHPNYVGDVGIGINPALARQVAQADLLLVVGARLGEMTTQGYTAPMAGQAPKTGQRLVHIHAGPEELGRVYPADLLIQSSMAVAGKALESLAAPVTVPWLAHLAEGQAAYAANRVPPPEAPLDLGQVVLSLERHLPVDTVYTNGAGNHTGWLHRYMRYGAAHALGRTQLAPTAGAMGYGLPAAVAASLLAPERHVVNFAGDGDFMMTGQEMATASAWRLGRPERGPGKLISILVDNGAYGTIRMHQERAYPDRVSGTALCNPDFVALARAYGWQAEAVSRTDAFEPALLRALSADAPTLLHLPIDVDVITTRARISQMRAAR